MDQLPIGHMTYLFGRHSRGFSFASFSLANECLIDLDSPGRHSSIRKTWLPPLAASGGT